MVNEMMSLSIDKAMLNPIIEKQVKLLMTEILGGPDLIIDKVIKNVLNTRVDQNGKQSSYSDAKPFFEHLFVEEIRKAVVELLQEEVKSRAGTIKKALKKYIQSQKGAEDLSNAMINAFGNACGNYWRTDFEIKLTMPERY